MAYSRFTLPEINCDLGEGVAFEDKIFPYIDAASIACGGHFGNEITIQQSLTLAKNHGTKVGAHPSYPDVQNFGRKSMDIPFPELAKSLQEQITLFLRSADTLKLEMDHIKFHGALYNDATARTELAKQLTDFLSTNFPSITVFVSPNSELAKSAIQTGLKVRLEVFGDRAYEANFNLMARTVSGSLFTTYDQVNHQLRTLLEKGEIPLASGEALPISAETICFHGDNPGILDFLPEIRKTYWK